MQKTARNWLGQRIGRLVVVARVANQREGKSIRSRWRCECDCGSMIEVIGASLNKGLVGRGGTRSCGCLLREKPIKHGKSAAKIYRLWNTMLQRCTNPKNPAYRSYGGRGIGVCPEWRDFRAFYADMGEPPRNYTLERVNNSWGYSKANCRWASRKDQGNNRRTNTLLIFRSRKQTLQQWADETGLGKACLSSRLNAGWSLDRALSTPKQTSRRLQEKI